MMDFFKSVFGAKPGSAAAKKLSLEHHSKGRAFCDGGDFDKAVPCFDEAIRLNGDMAKAYRDRGIAYLALGEENQALADFSVACRLDPGDARAFWNRGIVYRRKHMDKEADADFRTARRLDPTLKKEQS
jgi:tetratricopeptide (TPR) repeat protein